MLGYTPHISHDLRALKLWKTSQWDKLYPIIDAHRSFEDVPWPLMYQHLFERYPNSKFILTIRKSTDTWFKSLANHALKTGPTEHRRLIYGYSMPQENEIFHREFYEKHNKEIIQFFEKKAPNKLLVVCWEREDQWGEICQFLDKKIPNSPFPHLNRHQPTGYKKWLKKGKNLFRDIVKN